MYKETTAGPPKNRLNSNRKLGLRLTADAIFDDVIILNDLVVLFSSKCLEGVRPELLADVLSSVEKENLEKLVRAAEFLEDSLNLFASLEDMLSRGLMKQSEV